MSVVVQFRVGVDDVDKAVSEKFGDEFNAAAGTEGLEWETRVWHKILRAFA